MGKVWGCLVVGVALGGGLNGCSGHSDCLWSVSQSYVAT